MAADPYSLRCPVCGRAVVADALEHCPVCEADLMPIVGWRVHGARLYNRALEACAADDWKMAAALLEQARTVAPDATAIALQLGKVYAHLRRVDDARTAFDDALRLGADESAVRPAIAVLDGLRAARPRARPRWRLAAGVAALALLGIAALAGAYRAGVSQQPSPRLVQVLVTVLVPAATPSPAPSVPQVATPSTVASPSPSPAVTASAAPCPELAAALAERWLAVPALRLANLSVSTEGCTARITGSAATAHQIDVATATARAFGATRTDVTGVTVTGRYVVRNGDTLWSIARALYGDPSRYADIIRANSALPSDLRDLRVGQVLRIPPPAAR